MVATIPNPNITLPLVRGFIKIGDPLIELRNDPLCKIGRLCGIRDQNKIISTYMSGKAPFAPFGLKAIHQNIGRFTNDTVSSGKTISVVVGLKMVDVDVKKGKRIFLSSLRLAKLKAKKPALIKFLQSAKN